MHSFPTSHFTPLFTGTNSKKKSKMSGKREVGGDLPGSAPKGRAVVGKPKNKIASNMQITAEQLLLEARDRTEKHTHKPRSTLHDKEELREYRDSRRSEYEKLCQRNRMLIGNWTKYAKWEENQGEFTRTRSIFERAIDSIANNHTLYARYAEMEMRAGNIQHARNVWVRATNQLPRVDALWLKRVHLEETCGEIDMCRQVFKEWMGWKPKQEMWYLYVKFETRFKQVDNARHVIAEMVSFFNNVASWLYYARFEEKYGAIPNARDCYTQAIDHLSERADDIDKIFVEFAKFEERQNQLDRARAIYKIALDRIPKNKAPELYTTFLNFEKQYGERESIENALVSRKVFEYNETLTHAPSNYDVWFSYIVMLESNDQIPVAQVKDTYERAVAAIPTTLQKTYWSRYIYLWLMYANYEEVDLKSPDRAREVYTKALSVVPQKHFSFSKLWIAFAEFEIRQGQLATARTLMGRGLGVNPAPKMYRWYIDLEKKLGETDRVRSLYGSWLKKSPEKSSVYIKFALLEKALNEPERARAIFRLGANQPILEEPEKLWKRFIAMEVDLGNAGGVRALFAELVGKTKHVEVYVNWAETEVRFGEISRARAIYEDAEAELSDDDSEVKRILEKWLEFETAHGTPQDVEKVNAKINPQAAKKQPSKLLMRARALKRQKLEDGSGMSIRECFCR